MGIYEKPLAIPPEAEVRTERYHYAECPLDTLPPMDSRTFFHYMMDHTRHKGLTCHQAFKQLFYNRLPKKLGTSVLNQSDASKLQLGWGVHIIEGPDKPVLAWSVAAVLVVSLSVSVVYDVTMKSGESGFAIGQWLVGVLATVLAAVYFHLSEA